MSGKFEAVHGHCSGTSSATYQVWANMRDRCDNPENHAYNRYGGRGISYDPRWSLFENFLDDMGKKPSNKSLDRIDNDGDYSKDNCKWSTRYEQAQNRSTTTLLTHAGETLSIAAWSRRLRVTPTTLHKRLSKGWPLEKVLSSNDFRTK